MDVGGGHLGLDDRPRRVHLAGALVEVEKRRRTEEVGPGSPQLEQRCPALLVGILEDVAEGGSDVGAEQSLVRIRMVLDDGVHQVEHRQFQIMRNLRKE